MFERLRLWRQRLRARDLRPIDLKYTFRFDDVAKWFCTRRSYWGVFPPTFDVFAYAIIGVPLIVFPGLLIDIIRWLWSPLETYEPSKEPLYDPSVVRRHDRRWWARRFGPWSRKM